MARLLLASLFAGAAASQFECPGSAAYIYASAQIKVTFDAASCDDVKTEILARVNGEANWVGLDCMMT